MVAGEQFLSMNRHLELGCGMKKPVRTDWEVIGVDIRPFDGVDHVLNVGKDKWPFPDNYFDYINASHLLEHLYPEELFFCMDEAWRVCKPKGFFHIDVPMAGTPAYYVHPDHKIQFKVDTFGFFMPPSGGKDPHGYLKGFWHVTARVAEGNRHAISADLTPNKPGGNYDYVKIEP